MALICFASEKGAPGTTLTALATAAAWPATPGRRKLFVEADPDGGVLAVRYGLGLEPGLVTLAAAVRAGIDSSTLFAHAQELPGGLPLVTCPDNADQVQAALSAASGQLGALLADLDDVDVIADIGRLRPGSPALGLAEAAHVVLMVSHPTAEQLQPAARRLAALAPRTKSLGWVLVGNGPHDADEILATYGVPVVASIPHDSRAAAALEGHATTRRLRRTPLVRAANTLATNLAGWLHPFAEQTPAPEAELEREPQLNEDAAPTPLVGLVREPSLSVGNEPGKESTS